MVKLRYWSGGGEFGVDGFEVGVVEGAGQLGEDA